MAAECHVVPHVNLKMVRRLIYISITNTVVEEILHVELLRLETSTIVNSYGLSLTNLILNLRSKYIFYVISAVLF